MAAERWSPAQKLSEKGLGIVIVYLPESLQAACSPGLSALPSGVLCMLISGKRTPLQWRSFKMLSISAKDRVALSCTCH